MEEIRVHVVDKGRRNLYMRYRCPITGQDETRSTGTSKPREAAKVAAVWEAELQEGRYRKNGKIGWDEFTDFYGRNCLDALAPGTATTYSATLNKFKAFCKPGKLSDVTTARVTAFVAHLRKQKCSEATVARHLRTLKAVCRWANKQGLLAAVPSFTMPKRVKGAKIMRGRPITLEEFERMLTKAPEIASDAGSADFYLRGLWNSGLRLSESLTLSWEDTPGAIVVDFSGRYPMFRVPAEAEKGNRDRLLPMAPEFAEQLQAVPVGQRFGRVFRVSRSKYKTSKLVADIGAAAGVVTDPGEGPDTQKTATAHDLRRAFGARWSRKVMPTVLRELMRHSSLQTTMAYYVGDDAEETAKALWAAKGDTLGDTKPSEGHRSEAENRRNSLSGK